jgi:hypothetical protein
MATATKQYRVLIGLDHDKGRNEPGELYTGPAKSIPWLLEGDAIELDGGSSSSSSSSSDSKGDE